MEEIRSSPSVTTAKKRKQETSEMSRLKKERLPILNNFTTRAFLLCQSLAKKATARSEKEATEADVQISKMQVEAADNAEDTKKRLDKSM